MTPNLRPQKRSQLRIQLGRFVYTHLRYLNWILHARQFANKRLDKQLPYLHFEHATPLYRNLKNTEMWMQTNKITNLKLAIEQFDGLILLPGQTLSYWKILGKPTARKGFKEGMVLFYGTLKPGIGGGLCQLSNLLFWMTLHTQLTVIERYRHSYDVFPDTNRQQPFGSGATCVYNYRDLQIQNSTNYCFQLKLQITDNKLVGRWLCNSEPQFQYEVYEDSHIIKHQVWGGYSRHNRVFRKTYESSKLISDDFLFENHAIMMYQPFIEQNSQNKS